MACMLDVAITKSRSLIDEQQVDVDFGNRHGCIPPPHLPNMWPLGVDCLRELWYWNLEGHFLEFLCRLAKDYEPRNNLSQFMPFGPRVFLTLHPKNVKVVLSEIFECRSPPSPVVFIEYGYWPVFSIDFSFGVRRGVFYPVLADGIFTQEGKS
jgi:hypothetical protein